jgi:hypothetical protein
MIHHAPPSESNFIDFLNYSRKFHVATSSNIQNIMKNVKEHNTNPPEVTIANIFLKIFAKFSLNIPSKHYEHT